MKMSFRNKVYYKYRLSILSVLGVISAIGFYYFRSRTSTPLNPDQIVNISQTPSLNQNRKSVGLDKLKLLIANHATQKISQLFLSDLIFIEKNLPLLNKDLFANNDEQLILLSVFIDCIQTPETSLRLKLICTQRVGDYNLDSQASLRVNNVFKSSPQLKNKFELPILAHKSTVPFPLDIFKKLVKQSMGDTSASQDSLYIGSSLKDTKAKKAFFEYCLTNFNKIPPPLKDHYAKTIALNAVSLDLKSKLKPVIKYISSKAEPEWKNLKASLK